MRKILCLIIVLVNLSLVGCSSNVKETSSSSTSKVEVYFDALSFADKSKDDIISIYGEPESTDEWVYDRVSDGKSYKIKTLSYTLDNGEYWKFNFNNNIMQRISIDDCNIHFDEKNDVLSLFGCKKYSNTKTTDTNSALRYTNCGVADLWAWSIEDSAITGMKISYSNLFE